MATEKRGKATAKHATRFIGRFFFCIHAEGRSAQLSKTDGMRRPVSGRDAVRSQVIDVLKCTDKKETGNEEG
jgi:hypothetical protein